MKCNMKEPQKPIGIFDSGLGGLTVFDEINRLLPRENLIYFGDSAHVPYGIKSPQTITRYSVAIAKFLQSLKIKLLLIACNSASSVALGAIKKLVKVPVVDVITPGVSAAVDVTKNGRIAVIATKATVNSNTYPSKIKSMLKSARVYQIPCPLFVPLAEEGWWSGKITFAVAQKYLGSLNKKKVDTLILGCTHYPLIEKTIAQVVGDGVTLINSAKVVSACVKEVLVKKGLLNFCKKPETVFYVSDDAGYFKTFAQKILKKPVKKVILKNLNG